MNRAQLLTAYLAHKAAAAACEAALKAKVAEAYREEQVAETLRLPGGEVAARLTKPRVVTTDEDALLKWVAAAYPTEVTTEVVTTTVTRVRNPKWLETMLGQLTPVDPAEVEPGGGTGLMTGDGTVVPGVMWTPGGTLHSVAITGAPALVAEFARAARAYVEAGTPMPAISDRPHTEAGGTETEGGT